MSNDSTQNLTSFDEIINLARLKGVNFGKGDPYNRLRYYIKIGLLPKASRKSFNGLPPAGALPIDCVDKIVEIDKELLSGKSIQTIIKERNGQIQNPGDFENQPVIVQTLGSIPATASTFPPQEGEKEPQLTDINIPTNISSQPEQPTIASLDKTANNVSPLYRVNPFSKSKNATAKFLAAASVTGVIILLLATAPVVWLRHQNTSNNNKNHVAQIDKNNLPSPGIPGLTLGSTTEEGFLAINVPTNIKAKLTAGGGITTENTDVDAGTGKLTASNVIYSITAGQNVSITGGQNPVISAVAGSVNGTAGRITVSGSQVNIASNYAGQSSITTVGTITSGVWQGSTIADTFVSDSLTVDATGSVNWAALNNFPASCGAGEFVQAVGGTLTCGIDQLGGASPQTIEKDGIFFQTASILNYTTADIAVATGGASQVNLSLANTAVSAGSYPSDAAHVATFSVDAKGRLTLAGSTPIGINGNQITSGTIDDARLSANVSLLGPSIDLASEVTGTLPASAVGNGLTDAQVNNDITASNYLPLAGGTMSGGITGLTGVSTLGLTLSGFDCTAGFTNGGKLTTDNLGVVSCANDASGAATPSFSTISSGTNTTATMTVGTGASIVLTGTGSVEASIFKGSGSTTDAVDLATAEVAGSLPNANLANSSLTVTAGTGLSGGGSVSLGGSTTLTNAGVISVSCTTITCSGTSPASFSIANGAVGNSLLANSTISFTAGSSAMSVPTSIALGASGAFDVSLNANGPGLEKTSGLSLIRNCANGEILKYNTSGSGSWGCSNDVSGAGSASVSLRTANVVSALSILDFNDDVFNVTEPVANTANVTFRLATTGGSSSATFSGLQKITNGTTGGLSLLSCADGQILKKVTGDWTCSADAGGGGGGGGQTLNDTYQQGNSIDITNAYGNLLFNLTDATNDNHVIINNTTTGDVATAFAITSTGAGSTIGTAIDLSASAIGTALATGANDLSGTNWSITGSTGAASFVGVNSGTGQIQGTGGLSVTGATSINTSGSNATNIGTGTNAGTITIGNASTGDLALNDAQWSVTGAGAATFASVAAGSGAISGGAGSFTTLTSSGNSTIGTGASLTNSFGAGTGATNTFGASGGTNAINGSTTILGTTLINSTGTSATTIGNSTGTLALAGTTFALTTGSGLNVTTAGNISTTGSSTNATTNSLYVAPTFTYTSNGSYSDIGVNSAITLAGSANNTNFSAGIAVQGMVTNNNTGTIEEVHGADFEINNNGGGTINTAIGSYIKVSNNTGNINNIYGLYVDMGTGVYGIYNKADSYLAGPITSGTTLGTGKQVSLNPTFVGNNTGGAGIELAITNSTTLSGGFTGINFPNVAGAGTGSGTKTAIKIGTGWDALLSYNGNTVINGTGMVQTAFGGLGADVTAAGIGEVLYSTATNTYGHLAAGTNTYCLKAQGAGIAPHWDTCLGGSATSPFISSAGEITKDVAFVNDQVHLTAAQAGDYGLKVDTSIANQTVDLFQVTNTGFGTNVDAVNLASLNFTTVANAGNQTNAALKIDVTSGTNGASDNLYGINIGTLSTPGTGTENAINVGTGWDNILSANGTAIINVSGVLQSAGLSGTYSNALTLSGATNSITAGTLTATGGSINGTTIGAGTTSTGAFTTLTSSGNSTIGTGASLTNTFGNGTSAANTFGVSGGTNAINGSTTVLGSTLINSTGSATTAIGNAGTDWNISTTGVLTLGRPSTTQGSLVLDNTSAFTTTLKSSNTTSASVTYILPTADGGAGTVLSTDGGAATGVLSWVAAGGCPTCLVQVPTGNTANTANNNVISPTAASVIGLTINGTTNAVTAADVLDVVSGVNTGLVATNGILFNQNSAGTTTNGIDITRTAGTLTNGLVFNGTIGTDITSTDTNKAITITAKGSGALTLNSGATGALNLVGNAASSFNYGTNALTITSGTGASAFNTTATGINSTAIGATTASTGAFTTLTSSGNSTIGTGASLTNTFGNGTSATNSFGTGTGATNTFGASDGTNAINGATTILGTTLINSTGSAATTIGNATGTLALAGTTFALTAGSGLNVTTGGALTGVASIDTISTSATALTFAAAGTIAATGANALNLTAGAASAWNIGANVLTITSSQFNTTGTGINSTAIGATTASTGSFTTLSASSTVTLSGLAAGTPTNGLCIDASNHAITCATGASTTLQDAYNNGSTITTTNAKGNIAFTLAAGLTIPSSFTLTNNHVSGVNDFYINNANASGTNTDGILVEQTGAGALSNGVEIKQTAGTLTTGLKLTGTFTNLISATNFSVSNAGAITAGTYNSNTFTSTALTFAGASPAISASTAGTNITLDAGTSGAVNIAGTSTGSINFAGGFGSTGCTITTAGALSCDGTITGSGGISGGAGSFTTLTSSGNSTIGTGPSLTNSFGTGTSAANTIGVSGGTNAINGSTTVLGTTLINSTGTAATTIGNSTGALALAGTTFALTAGSGLNVTTGGALTGVASIDTITTSATALTFAAGGTIAATGANALTLTGAPVNINNSGSGDTNIGTTTNTGNVAIGNSTGTFALISNGGLNVTTGGAITTVGTYNTNTFTSTALTFSGASPAISASTAGTNITLDAGTSGAVNIAGTSTGSINFAGGFGSTGCTITTAGALSCDGTITGAATGTIGYWSRTGTTLSPATAGDNVSITTSTAGQGLVLSSTASTNTSGILQATVTSATTGNSGINLNYTSNATGVSDTQVGFDLTYNTNQSTNANNAYAQRITNGNNTGITKALIVLDNADTTAQSLTNGILFQNSGGTDSSYEYGINLVALTSFNTAGIGFAGLGGTLIDNTSSGSQASSLTGVSLNFSSLTGATTKNLTGYNFRSPALATTSGATTYTGYSIAAAGAIGNSTAGSFTWNGASFILPKITQGGGSTGVVANGANIIIPTGTDSITTAGILNGIQVGGTGNAALANGPSAGTLNFIKLSDITTSNGGTVNGISIGSIGTPGAGTETAINIGTGWDVPLQLPGTNNVAGIQFGTDANLVNLYRVANDILKTDDSFRVGTLAAAATTAVCLDGSNTFASCSSGAGTGTLQSAYNNGNTILMTSSRNVAFSDIAGTKFILDMAAATAPTIDMMDIVNTGASQPTVTTGVDALQLDFAIGAAGGIIDNAALRINTTSAGAAAGSTLAGINIGTLTSPNANVTESAIKIGTGWDTEINLTSTTPKISIGNGGTLAFTDGTNNLVSIVDSGTYGRIQISAATGGDPGTCNAGEIYYNSTSSLFKGCTSTNTWGAVLAGSGFVTLAPTVADTNSTANSSIFINNTSSGNFLNLQKSGTSVITIGNGGAFTQKINSVPASDITSVKDSTLLLSATDVAISGRYAYYLAHGVTFDRLTAVDISDPTAPTVEGSASLTGLCSNTGNRVIIAGKYAFVSCPNNVVVIDISNQKVPLLVGYINDTTNLATVRSMAVSGHYLFALDYQGSPNYVGKVVAIDITTPTTSRIVGVLADSGSCGGAVNICASYDMVIQNKYLYLSSTDASGSFGISIINISNPANMTQVGVIAAGSNTTGNKNVAISGRYLYQLATNSIGGYLCPYDVANPAAPVAITCVSAGTTLESIIIAGNYAYVTDSGANAILVFDISSPATPTLVTTIIDSTNLSGAKGLAVSGQYAYVAAGGDNRATIVKLGGSNIPLLSLGSLSTTSGEVLNDFSIGNNLSVRGGMNLGLGGLQSQGDISAAGTIALGAQVDATSAIATTNPNAGQFGAQSGLLGAFSSAVYNGKLYVSTKATNASGIYRYDGGTTWTLVSSPTLGQVSGGATDVDASVLTVYNGLLYAGTQTAAGTGAIYSFNGGVGAWTQVTNATRGTFVVTTDTAIDGVTDMTVWNGHLYAFSQKTNAAGIYRFDGGTTWTRISGATLGTVVAADATDVDGGFLTSYSGRLFAGTITGSTTARVLMYDGAAWTLINTTRGTFNTTANIPNVSSLAVYMGQLFVGTGNNDLAEVYRYNGGTVAVAGAAVFTKISDASGKMVSGDTANIDSVVMRPYNGRLYVGTNTVLATDGNSAALYEYDGISAFTLINATRGTFGAQTGVSAIDSLVELNGTLYVGTEEAGLGSIYSWTKTLGNSNVIKFDSGFAAATGGVNNFGSIGFVQGFDAQGGSNENGSFIFNHSISSVSGAYDVAEDYPTRDDTLQAGDIVSIDPNESGFVQKTNSTYDDSILGVYSDNPGLHLSQTDTAISGGRAVAIALVGRVSVKVSSENGLIQPGDALTSSSKPGVAMKATVAGNIVGKALEPYTEVDPTKVGKISVAVKNGYWAPPLAQQVANASLTLGNLNIGNLTISDSLIIGNNITLDKYGKMQVNGQLIVKGTIQLTGNLTINGNIDATSVAANEFKVKTITNDPAATAGSATLLSGTKELIINTTKVADTSLVFITPTTQTDQQLAVVQKIAATSFKVTVPNNATADITFNWIIVNQQISQGN